ncbi:MAG: hypothetical protein KIG91_08575 [Treponema sp.]|nr:hypothetical protein [Treponema sp.]
MFKLAAVFSPGFEKVIPKALKDVLPDAYNLNVTSGFLRFCTDKNPFRAVNADFLNNSFLVLKEWNGDSKNAEGSLNKAPAFEVMANKIRIPDQLIPEITKQHYKTFRLRFSQANVFTSVNKNVMANVEKQISQATGMKPDRLGGDTEFWFLTRTNGYACFALRMTKKQSTEKYLEKGELRPEFVTLLAAFADTDGELRKASSAKATATRNNGGGAPIGDTTLCPDAKATATQNNGATSPTGDTTLCPGAKATATRYNGSAAPTGAHDASTGAPSDTPNDAQRPVLLDPFAGHGGIVKRLAQMYPKAQILASELDGDLAKKLKGCRQADATNLFYLEDNSVDCVITDPPWGFWQGDLRDDKKLRALYDGMLKEMFRVTKPGASLCILTAAKEVFEAAFDASSFAGAHNAAARNNAVSEGTTDIRAPGGQAAHNAVATPARNAVSEGTSDIRAPGGQTPHNAVATPAHNAAARHNAVSEGTSDICAPGGQAAHNAVASAHNAVATPAHNAVSEGTANLCAPEGQAAHNAVSEGTAEIRAQGGQPPHNAVATPAYKAADIRNDVLVNGKKAAVYVWHK